MLDADSYKDMSWDMKAEEVDGSYWIGKAVADKDVYGFKYAMNVLKNGKKKDQKDYNVKATFFITYKPKYKNVIKRAYNEGHTIALHTASHKYSYVYKSVNNYFKDLKKVSDFAESITGEKSMLIRFPGGSSNTVSKS